MYIPTKSTPSPKIQRVSLNDWLKGKGSTQDDGRIDPSGLTAAQNVLLEQDGVIRPWPSMVAYGPQPTGTVLGEVGDFKVVDGLTDTKWLITVQNVSGTARVYIRKDQDAWIECTGKDFDLTARCHFAQIDNKVLITNGVDNLSYLDIDPDSGTYQDVIPFVQVDTPSTTGAVQTGLTGTTYPLSYKVTSSNQGESAASAAFTVNVVKIRGSWNGTSEYVTITADRETNAEYYHVYINDASNSSSGEWEYIGSVKDPGTGSTWSFRDTGSVSPDYTRTAPLGDSSAGPKASRASVINGRVYLTGDADNPRYVRFGGDVLGSELDFSPYGGGGYVEIGAGGKEIPLKVVSFRNGQGIPSIMALCQTSGGRGKRYILSPETTTLGSTLINFMSVAEDNGEDGTDAPDGVLVYKDALWYPSLDGFKSTFTKQQIQNILSTDEVSEAIEPDVNNISLSYLDKCCGVAFKGRLYWALPVGSSSNNQIWTLDLKRGRGWMLPRNVDADWLTLYEDNAGKTHFLVLSNNNIYEFSYASLTNDDGTAFSTYARSGIIKFSDDGEEYASVIDIKFVFLRPRGSIEIQVDGLLEDEETSQSTGTKSFNTATEYAGWSETSFTSPNEWGTTLEVPEGSTISRKTTTVEIDEELKWLTWSIKTNDAGVDYRLADVIVRYVNIGTKDESE